MKSSLENGSPIRTARIAAVLGVGMIVLGSVGCNTAEGLGEDVEAAGEGIQEIAEDTKDAIKD
jgi:predicted small secreted protein